MMEMVLMLEGIEQLNDENILKLKTMIAELDKLGAETNKLKQQLATSESAQADLKVKIKKLRTREKRKETRNRKKEAAEKQQVQEINNE